MTEKQVTSLFDKTDIDIETYLKAWQTPGCAVAVVKDGAVVHAQGYGLRNIKDNLPATTGTLFAIGSCSKAFTAMAVGMLVDDGKLDWDKPVRDYAPDFRMHDPFTSERMTARDLLTHRSGLPLHDMVWLAANATRQDLFSRLRYLEPNKDFRTTWQYQNLMYMAAGVLIERVAGCAWEEFVRRRIFEPLGMSGSNFSVTISQQSADFALPYHEKDDGVIEIPFRNIDAIAPAGAINAGVADMTNWLLLQLNHGKRGDQQLITEHNLKEMHTPQMVTPAGDPEDKESGYGSYGLGWFINTYRGHPFVQHGGEIDGFSSLVTLLPERNSGIVVLSNRDGTPLPAIVTNAILDRLLGLEQIDLHKRLKERETKQKAAIKEGKEKSETEQKTAAPPSHALADYAGRYENPGYGSMQISLEEGKLHATYGRYNVELKHVRYETFTLTFEAFPISMQLAFQLDINGDVSAVNVLYEPAVKPIVFARMADPVMQERSQLEKFVGEYDVMGMTASVTLKGVNTLMLIVPGQPPYELVPFESARFRLKGAEGFQLAFNMDEGGQVTEAVFHQPNGTFVAKRKPAA